jgi:predicted small integral membrane protein
MNDRIVRILLSAVVGLYLGFVVFNNVFDYAANFEFVSHVAKMDDIFSKDNNSWRSFQNPVIHQILYLFIIFWEFTLFALLIKGAFNMFRALNTDKSDFKKAKQLTSMALTAGVILWFFVFLTIGGEWFLMWQSKIWNAQQNAFSLTICFMLFLIFHNQEHD